MKNYTTEMVCKVVHLRNKYSRVGDTRHNDYLNNILWYSIPIVYPNYISDARSASHQIDLKKQKRKRYRRYVREMVDEVFFNGNSMYLVSLTFNDDALNGLSSDTRKKYVRDYLNSISDDYFACIDFGKENQREHYHAVISTGLPMLSEKHGRRVFFKPLKAENAWLHGFFSFRKINDLGNDIYRTLNYALKSSDYAFKFAESDARCKPFHKRGVKHISRCALTELPY